MNIRLITNILGFLIFYFIIFIMNPLHIYTKFSNVLFYFSPLIIFIVIIKLKKIKTKIIFSVFIIPVILLLMLYSFLYIGFGITKFRDTACSENIKIASQNGIFNKFNIVEKHLYGLLYILDLTKLTHNTLKLSILDFHKIKYPYYSDS